jgi:hypothetical protein
MQNSRDGKPAQCRHGSRGRRTISRVDTLSTCCARIDWKNIADNWLRSSSKAAVTINELFPSQKLFYRPLPEYCFDKSNYLFTKSWQIMFWQLTKIILHLQQIYCDEILTKSWNFRAMGAVAFVVKQSHNLWYCRASERVTCRLYGISKYSLCRCTSSILMMHRCLEIL